MSFSTHRRRGRRRRDRCRRGPASITTTGRGVLVVARRRCRRRRARPPAAPAWPQRLRKASRSVRASSTVRSGGAVRRPRRRVNRGDERPAARGPSPPGSRPARTGRSARRSISPSLRPARSAGRWKVTSRQVDDDPVRALHDEGAGPSTGLDRVNVEACLRAIRRRLDLRPRMRASGPARPPPGARGAQPAGQAEPREQAQRDADPESGERHRRSPIVRKAPLLTDSRAWLTKPLRLTAPVRGACCIHGHSDPTSCQMAQFGL